MSRHSDIFSLGVLIYYMLTGDDPRINPFGICSPENIGRRIREKGLANLLAGCLQMDHHKRFQSVGEMRYFIVKNRVIRFGKNVTDRIYESCCGSRMWGEIKFVENAVKAGFLIWMALCICLALFTSQGRALLSTAVDKFDGALFNEEKYMEKSRDLFSRDQYAEAAQYLDKLLQKNPKYVAAYEFRSAVRTRLGDVDGALRDLDTAMRICPEKKLFYFEMKSSIFNRYYRHSIVLEIPKEN